MVRPERVERLMELPDVEAREMEGMVRPVR